jgi:predicted nucleic acid-binding protein
VQISPGDAPRAVALDTDAASLLMRRDLPQELGSLISGATLCVTFVTVGELYKGAFKRGWGPKRVAAMEAWLRNVIVLPYTAGVARTWGRLVAECEKSGRPLPANDSWIAACCMQWQIPLMTLNRRHFEGIPGLALVP